MDVLPYVDVERDLVEGDWQRAGDEVTVSPGASSRLALPVTLGGSYDLENEFARSQGDDAIAVVFPVGHQQIALVLSAAGGKCNGMELLDDRGADHPRNPSIRRPGIIQNGRRHRVLIGVRLKADKTLIDVVLIRAWRQPDQSTGLPRGGRRKQHPPFFFGSSAEFVGGFWAVKQLWRAFSEACQGK